MRMKMKNIEEYIRGFEGRYVVSNMGYIRRCGKKGKPNYGTLNNRKDYIVHITDNAGKSRIMSISRIVAEHFIPNPENKPQVDHISTDRSNNRADNLRWVWPKENMANARTRINRKEPKLFAKKRCPKPCKAELPTGEIIYADTLSELANKLGCSPITIRRCYDGIQPFYNGNIIIKPVLINQEEIAF